MKKFVLYPILILLGIILTSVLGLLLILFFSPTTIINPKNINLVLEKTQVLKSWSWKEAKIDHHWISWKERRVNGYFKDLCFDYQSPSMNIKNCFSEFNWDFNLNFDTELGLNARTLAPLKIYSPKTTVTLHDEKEAPKKEEAGPPNIWRYWTILWSDVVPDLDVAFHDIELISQAKTTKFDLKLTKQPKQLRAETLGFVLTANEKKFELLAPAIYPLPMKNQTLGPLRLIGFKLKGEMSKDGIPLVATGAVEPIAFTINSYLDLPLKHSFDSVTFKKQMMLATKADLAIINIRNSLTKHGPQKYKTLPAPLNEMNGDIKTHITSAPGKERNSVLFSAATNIDLQGERQVFQMDLMVEAPIDAKTLAPGSILMGIDFRNISILLPRISKKSLPPQFKPDGRIRNAPFSASLPAEDKKGSELTLHMQALNERALHLKTNLLDEVLRLNFDLLISKGEMQSGFVQVLPLKTTVFKRPIRVEYLKITFNHPLEPVIESTIKFPLPEYKITLKLAGPLSRPRHSFTSEPPLPQSDIHAVLLFGRPMSELDPDDKGAAQQTNKMLSQGILSLSVLYFLAGSPVEYVGYDPNSRNASAQIGLGKKSSLRVGGSGSGVNSTAVRRSLGRGWYLDTSVQDSSTTAGRDEKNYGVMLERIIAY